MEVVSSWQRMCYLARRITVILGTAGAATLEVQHLVGVVILFVVGFALGNIDGDIRKLFMLATREFQL